MMSRFFRYILYEAYLMCVLVSCAREEQPHDVTGGNTARVSFQAIPAETKASAISPAGEVAVVSLDLLVFRSDGGALEAHVRTTDNTTVSASLIIGEELRWYLIANVPESLGLGDVSSEAELLSKKVSMSHLASGSIPMHASGLLTLTDADRKTPRVLDGVELVRYACKLTVSGISVPWLDSFDVPPTCILDRIVVVNARGDCPLSGEPTALSSDSWYNRSEDACPEGFVGSLLGWSGSIDCGSSVVPVGVSLYAMPNASAGRQNAADLPWEPRQTRICFRLVIDGIGQWYAVDVPAMTGNDHYVVSDLVVKGPGTAAPDMGIDRTPVEFALVLNPWDEQETVLKTPDFDVPLTFNILTGGTVVWQLYQYTGSEPSTPSVPKTIEYSINGGEWHAITSSVEGASFNVEAGDVVTFRGDNVTYCERIGDYERERRYSSFSNDGTATFTVTGSFASILADNYIPDRSLAFLFRYCDRIVSLDWPEEFTVIPAHMFFWCKNLVSVRLPETLKEIHYSAFRSCRRLADINLPKSLEVIKNLAFYYCPFTNDIDLPALRELGGTAFCRTNIERILNLGTIVSFSNGNGGTWLESMDALGLQDLVVEVGMFSLCPNLREVHLPAGTRRVGSYMFYGCPNLTTITGTDGCEEFGVRSFMNCVSLQDVDLSSAKKIENSCFYNAGLFDKDINVPQLTSIGSDAFRQSRIRTVSNLGSVITSIPQSCFRECKQLENVVLPSSCVRLGYEAFDSSVSLTSINLENIVKYDDYALYNCRVIHPVFNSGITSIGKGAFLNNIFEDVIVDLPNLETIGGGAFNNTGIIEIKNLGSITAIPDAIPSFDTSGTFGRCTKLFKVTFPSTLQTIGTYAFNRCHSLEVIDLPPSVTTINAYSFNNTRWNERAMAVESLGSVTSLPAYVMGHYDKLAELRPHFSHIIFPETLTKLVRNTFSAYGHDNSMCYVDDYVVFKGTTPPTLEGDNYNSGLLPLGTYPIYVPYGSGESYRTAESWTRYSSRIVELTPEGLIP